MLAATAIILILILGVEIVFKPRLDITSDNRLLLWYGRSNRKYVFLN
jgi:hypothetical protein